VRDFVVPDTSPEIKILHGSGYFDGCSAQRRSSTMSISWTISSQQNTDKTKSWVRRCYHVEHNGLWVRDRWVRPLDGCTRQGGNSLYSVAVPSHNTTQVIHCTTPYTTGLYPTLETGVLRKCHLASKQWWSEEGTASPSWSNIKLARGTLRIILKSWSRNMMSCPFSKVCNRYFYCKNRNGPLFPQNFRQGACQDPVTWTLLSSKNTSRPCRQE